MRTVFRPLPLPVIVLVAAGGAMAAEPAPRKQPIRVSELMSKYELIGRTGQPLFKHVRLEGVVVEGPHKGWEGGPNLRVQRVNGVATQDGLQIVLRASFKGDGRADGNSDPEVERGKTYELRGYEDGDFVGTPLDAYEEAGVEVNFQTRSLYLRTSFVPLRVRAIQPIAFGPADFVGRKAVLQGTAVSRDGRSFIDGKGWRLLVRADGAWPGWLEGKTAEAYGLIRKGAGDDNAFVAEGAAARPVRLEDLVGREVELRGTAWSINGHWWFDYRGTSLYVDDMKKLTGWTFENHGRPMVIRGRLERGKRPDLKQITLVMRPPLKEYFVVQGASWAPLDELLSPERADE